MAADNYTEIAETMAEQDGGLSEFGYNPQTGRVEFETAEEREIYVSAGEIGMYGDDEFTEEEVGMDAIQDALGAIQELYMFADGMDYVENMTGAEVQAMPDDLSEEDLEPEQEEELD